jgi:hypothetical protein
MLRKGKKPSSRRISPEPQAMASGGGAAAENNLQETVEVQAQAIREMTTSLERASKLMEKQSDTFTTDMAALQDIKTKLEARVKELEAKVSAESPSIAAAAASSSSSSLLSSRPAAPSDPPSALVCPDPVEAAEMMIELDDIIMTVKRKGAAKSLPSIVKHVITLFRYFFPAQLVEIVVLDPYSEGVFWSMECRTGGDSQVVFFDDSGEDLRAESKLMADVIAQGAIASIKDGAHEANFGESDIANAGKASANVPMLKAPSDGAVERWAKNQNARIASGGGVASSGLMIPIRDNRNTISSQSTVTEAGGAGGTAPFPVLAVLHIVNRMDARGNVVNFAKSDLSLLKLLVMRCSEIFRQTRTLTGLLSASRRRFGSFDGVLGKSVTLNVSGGEAEASGESKSLDAQMRQTSIEQQLSQTKSWLKEKLAHREYKMIFTKRNPAIQTRLNTFIVVLKALCKFLKTLARYVGCGHFCVSLLVVFYDDPQTPPHPPRLSSSSTTNMLHRYVPAIPPSLRHLPPSIDHPSFRYNARLSPSRSPSNTFSQTPGQTSRGHLDYAQKVASHRPERSASHDIRFRRIRRLW